MHVHLASLTRIHLLILATVFLTAACSSVGPRSIRTDQVDYADALSEAAKRQTLLNIVKLRYGDYPSFVSVSQLVAGYQLQGIVTLGTELLDFNSGSFAFGNDASLTAQGTFSDNPTVTYSPLTGSDFARTLLAPLPPTDIFALLLAGVPPRLLFGLGLTSISSYRNDRGSFLGQTRADAEFVELVGILSDLLSAGYVSITRQVVAGAKDNETILLLEIAEESQGSPLESSERRFRELLKLNAAQSEFKIVYGGAHHPHEIGVRTRSLIEVLGEVGQGVELPQDEPGAAVAAPLPTRPGRPTFDPQVRILSTRVPPLGEFAAVRYAGRWFYIAADDLASKQTFTFIMLLFSLAESSKPGQLPVLTIPAG